LVAAGGAVPRSRCAGGRWRQRARRAQDQRLDQCRPDRERSEGLQYALLAFRRSGFDAWYFTPGGFAGGIPGVFNKQVFVTGRQEGTSIKPFKQ